MKQKQQQRLLNLIGVDVYKLRADNIQSQDIPAVVETTELIELSTHVSSCELCGLYKSRTKTVFGTGNLDANVMFVGEAPGHDEDVSGEPFVGRAGQLLNLMLDALGWKREDVYITNILKCRPPNNRNPDSDEITQCEPYLIKQIESVNPGLLVALGRVSAQYLLGTRSSISQLRGKKHLYEKSHVPLVVTYHPAYLLRNPIDKSKAWQDLLFIRSCLE